MFNKFASILQHAVEALAPDAPLHDDFIYHWKSVTNFYIENTDDKTPVSLGVVALILIIDLKFLLHFYPSARRGIVMIFRMYGCMWH